MNLFDTYFTEKNFDRKWGNSRFIELPEKFVPSKMYHLRLECTIEDDEKYCKHQEYLK